MHLIPGPRQVLRESLMLTELPRGLLALGRIWALPGVPVTHTEAEGDPVTDAPPPLPSHVTRDQPVTDGWGPMLHRRFRIEVEAPPVSARELVALLAADMNQAMVPGVARFDRLGDAGRALAVDDEFVVRMPGPWDGPVRVVERTDEPARASFRLATLAGHLEAGQIEFAAEDAPTGDGPAGLRFTITTWARAGDLLADVMYNRLGVAKEIQFQLWVHCCVRAGALAGGRAPQGVDVVTRVVRATRDLAADPAPPGHDQPGQESSG